MRSGTPVVIGLLLIGVVLGVLAFVRTSRSAVAVHDLFTGLAYYAETHDGHLPADVDALVAAPFVERVDGGFRVLQRDTTQLRRDVYGRPIDDVARFNIPWGLDLDTLTVDPEGIVHDPNESEVQLLSFGRNPDLARRFSRDMLFFLHDAKIIDDPRAQPPTSDEMQQSLDANEPNAG